MGKKRKAASILKRKPPGIEPGIKNSKKKQKLDSKSGLQPLNVPNKSHNKKPNSLFPNSVTHRRAAFAVARLLAADASGRDGASLKSLTLAPHIENKRAVYAVTVETLKHVPVLEKLYNSSGLEHTSLPPAAAYVLCQDLLWGQGLHPQGPAERAVLKVENALRENLDKLLRDAGTADVTTLLPATALAAAAERRPRTARVNELKLSVDEALQWLRDPPKQHAKLWKAVVGGISQEGKA